MLDRSCQDIGFFASFRCEGNCNTGVLLRAQKTATGMKGIYVSLTPGDLGSYRVTLDGEGRELSRERLRPAAGQYRYDVNKDGASDVITSTDRGTFVFFN